MDTNSLFTLDEKDFPETPAGKRSPLRWLIFLVVLGGIGYGSYRYRDSLMSLVRPPVPAEAAAANSAGGGRGNRGGGGGAGISVVAVAARKLDMPIYLRGLGSVTPYSTVTVRSRVDGQLVKVAFTEGQFVREGDLLAEIDSRPFKLQLEQAEAQLDQAKGNLARDTGLLKGATSEYVRDEQLLGKGLIPSQQADTQSATLDQFEGSIQADHASMETAQTAISNANLQIAYCRVTAPISGRIGLRQVDQGNIVRSADPNGLAVIAQLQPIAVLFSIPEDNLTAILQKLRAGATLRVDAYDRDDQTKLASGTLVTVDNEIDQSTGTSKLKAVFDNDDNSLFPNQFVNIHLLLEVERNATVIPNAAIQHGPQGTYVYVVGPDKRARIRPVGVKSTEGSDVAVGGELRPGELVVVEGTDKVQDGGRVNVEADDADQSGSLQP